MAKGKSSLEETPQIPGNPWFLVDVPFNQSIVNWKLFFSTSLWICFPITTGGHKDLTCTRQVLCSGFSGKWVPVDPDSIKPSQSESKKRERERIYIQYMHILCDIYIYMNVCIYV